SLGIRKELLHTIAHRGSGSLDEPLGYRRSAATVMPGQQHFKPRRFEHVRGRYAYLRIVVSIERIVKQHHLFAGRTSRAALSKPHRKRLARKPWQLPHKANADCLRQKHPHQSIAKQPIYHWRDPPRTP